MTLLIIDIISELPMNEPSLRFNGHLCFCALVYWRIVQFYIVCRLGVDTMPAAVRHCILGTSSLAILFGTACESSSSLRATAISMIRMRGLLGSTYAKHACHSHRLYRNKLVSEVLRREEDASDDEDEIPLSRRRRHDLG